MGADLQVSALRQDDTHRLIPSRYSQRSVLERLAAGPEEVDALLELDAVTNERLLAEANLLPGIDIKELLFGVTYGPIVNATFTHPHPDGSRFNGPDRGAWYAAFDLETARTEVAFHKRAELEEIGWVEPEVFTFQDFLADFRADFHDLRDNPAHPALDPGSYAAGQEFARQLLAAGSAGVVYPSVRHPDGTCLVCFRPALVTHVRPGNTVVMTLGERQR